MLKTPLYNLKNEVVGELELPEKIFGAPWRPALVKQILLAIAANRRRPWAHAKDRSEVRGGGKKPWRQKGTGRARHGSIRSPLWSGGGKAHGPIKDRDYSQKVNKKMRQSALVSVLSRKFQEGEVKFFDTLAFESPKTKLAFKTLQGLLDMPKKEKRVDALVVPHPEDKNSFRAIKNLVKAKAVRPEELGVEDLVRYGRLLMDRDAVQAISRHFRHASKAK